MTYFNRVLGSDARMSNKGKELFKIITKQHLESSWKEMDDYFISHDPGNI